MSLVVGRMKGLPMLSTRITSTDIIDEVDVNVVKTDDVTPPMSLKSDQSCNGLTISHVRSKSAPAIHHKNGTRNGQHNDQVYIVGSRGASQLGGTF